MIVLWLGFLLCEIAYVVAVRWLVGGFHGSESELEVAWSVLRVMSIVPLYWIFGYTQRAGTPAKIPRAAFLSGVIFIIPVLGGRMGLAIEDRTLFAATSVLVGIREELAYRGILQNLLRRYGLWVSLLVSNVVFVLYHYGVQPFTVASVLQLFTIGLLLGFVYHLTGTLWFSIALHSIYDAIFAYTPLIAHPWPVMIAPVITGVVVVALVVIANKSAAGERISR